ncbi:copper homeostasis protein CutC [Rhodobacter sp. SGA-6-6]|uniref:copper homeostasis protein CutC n=1 Tax=Rhodobacter sp. SGA-6-6 TaxID=2710882 RepID=UPI003211F701
MDVILEVCVDTSAGLDEAVAGGADRIELCAALALGGLTPSAGFMAEAARCGLPVMAMIRLRAGDFVFSEVELVQMEKDIAAARTAGLAGVVLGASLPDGRLDLPALRRLRAAAGEMDCTLHRTFDLVPDQAEALEQALHLRFSRILTSGGERTAEAGAERIAALLAQAKGRISIMPGSGITAANAPRFLAMGATELHASCSVPAPATGRAVDLGFAPAAGKRTDAAAVKALRQALR